MNQKKQTAEAKVKEIRRHTRKKYSAEFTTIQQFIIISKV